MNQEKRIQFHRYFPSTLGPGQLYSHRSTRQKIPGLPKGPHRRAQCTSTHSERVSDSHSVVSDSLWPHGLLPARLRCPRDSPDKNTGVGCHFPTSLGEKGRIKISKDTKSHAAVRNHHSKDMWSLHLSLRTLKYLEYSDTQIEPPPHSQIRWLLLFI